MSAAVWKFTFPVADEVSVEMPSTARILSVGMDPARASDIWNTIAVWAAVDPDAPRVQHLFYVRGTGHPLHPAETPHFIGTVIDAPFVWHVFDGGAR